MFYLPSEAGYQNVFCLKDLAFVCHNVQITTLSIHGGTCHSYDAHLCPEKLMLS